MCLKYNQMPFSNSQADCIQKTTDPSSKQNIWNEAWWFGLRIKNPEQQIIQGKDSLFKSTCVQSYWWVCEQFSCWILRPKSGRPLISTVDLTGRRRCCQHHYQETLHPSELPLGLDTEKRPCLDCVQSGKNNKTKYPPNIHRCQTFQFAQVIRLFSWIQWWMVTIWANTTKLTRSGLTTRMTRKLWISWSGNWLRREDV